MSRGRSPCNDKVIHSQSLRNRAGFAKRFRLAAFPRLPNAGLVPETRREVAIAAVLLAFAQECAPAQDACGRPLGCVIDAGPFNGAGLGAEAGEGADVEPRSG